MAWHWSGSEMRLIEGKVRRLRLSLDAPISSSLPPTHYTFPPSAVAVFCSSFHLTWSDVLEITKCFRFLLYLPPHTSEYPLGQIYSLLAYISFCCPLRRRAGRRTFPLPTLCRTFLIFFG